MILASDGVWEFISSQEAVDIVATCDNPYEAAHRLIEAAWKLWLQYDVRTDDITALVIFTHIRNKPSDPSKNEPARHWAAAAARAPAVNSALSKRNECISSWSEQHQ